MLKLADTKANKPGMNLLHFVAQVCGSGGFRERMSVTPPWRWAKCKVASHGDRKGYSRLQEGSICRSTLHSPELNCASVCRTGGKRRGRWRQGSGLAKADDEGFHILNAGELGFML